MGVFGATWIRVIAVVGATVVFAFLYGVFMAEAWNASSTVPKLDQDDVKIATALAGALGALFAVALGVEAVKDGGSNGAGRSQRRSVKTMGSVGRTLAASESTLVAGAATLAVWTYFLTGLAAAITWQFNKDVAPGVVKTLATVMGGYVIALVGALAASRDRT
jgi:hypothetical protein